MKIRPSHLRRHVALLAVVTLLVALPAMAAKPGTLKPFTATYQANYLGLHGTGTMTLAPTSGDRWSFSLNIDSAIAKLSQNTVFDANGGKWKPLSGTDSSMLLIKKSTKQADYDWKAREARWKGDIKSGRAGPVPLRNGDLDAMLLNLAIPRDVAAGKPLNYRMVDNGRAKQMQYEVAGNDSVQIGNQSRPATKVTRTDGDKQTVIWVVADLPVPARILQREKGKDQLDLQLQSIR